MITKLFGSRLLPVGLAVLAMSISACEISGVCVGNKKQCEVDNATPPSGSGTGGYNTGETNGCASAGDILGTDWASESGTETMSFDKNCAFASARSGCNLKGHYTVPHAAGADLKVADEETARALDTNGAVAFFITGTTGKPTTSTDDSCPPNNSTINCTITFADVNHFAVKSCTIKGTDQKYFQHSYKR